MSDDDHDYDDDEEPAPRRRQSRRLARGIFQCPFCGSLEVPVTKTKVSTAGWVMMVVLLFFCFPLFWIGLFITESYRECYDCGTRIGG